MQTRRLAGLMGALIVTMLLTPGVSSAYNGCQTGQVVIDSPATCGYTAHHGGAYEATALSWCIWVERGNRETERYCRGTANFPDSPSAGILHTIEGDNVFARMYPTSYVCAETEFGECWDAGVVGAQDVP